MPPCYQRGLSRVRPRASLTLLTCILSCEVVQIENRLNVIGGGSGLSDGPSIPETSPALAGADHASFSIGSRGPTPLVMESDRQSSQPDCISTGEHDEEELQDDGHQIQSESSASPAINQFVSVDLVEQLLVMYAPFLFLVLTPTIGLQSILINVIMVLQ